MRVYVVRKWPLWGRSRFVCRNITRGSLWLYSYLTPVALRYFIYHRQLPALCSMEYLLSATDKQEMFHFFSELPHVCCVHPPETQGPA